jgi:hypothetical protein
MTIRGGTSYGSKLLLTSLSMIELFVGTTALVNSDLAPIALSTLDTA